MKKQALLYALVMCMLGSILGGCAAETSSSSSSSSPGVEVILDSAANAEEEMFSFNVTEEPVVRITTDANISDSDQSDPRTIYTMYIQNLVRQIEETPEDIPCSDGIKAALLLNPGVIPEANRLSQFFVYAVVSTPDSDVRTTTVAHYKETELITETITFTEKDGAITVNEIDKLLTFMSGDAYA